MIVGIRVNVNDAGIASQPGVHFGRERQTPNLVERCGEYALFHLPGGTNWGGTGYVYTPTSYDLVELSGVQETEGIGFSAMVSKLIEQQAPGNGWPTVKRAMVERLRILGAAST